MILPISRSDYVCGSYNRISPAFTKKPDLTPLLNDAKKSVVSKKIISESKYDALCLLSDLVGAVTRGRVWIRFDSEFGYLKAMSTYEKGKDGHLQLKCEKHYYPGRKLLSQDDYKDGKLAKTVFYREDGKTPKWMSEYLHGEDIINEYYPDGKTVKFLTVECADYSNRYEYSKSGQLLSQDYCLNDVIVKRTVYDKKNGTETIKNYDNGKLKNEVINHSKGQIKRREISYDENENTKKVKIFYNNPTDYAEADYDGDIVVLKRYLNKNLRYTETKNRKTGEKNVVYASKKNVKKS